MRAREFLSEYSREKTAGVFGKKILAAVAKDRSAGPQLFKQYRTTLNATPVNEIDPSILQNIINFVMQGFESADPTANKEYVQWMAKVYANEGVMFEDMISKTTEWLQRYDLYKKKRLFKGDYANFANIMNLSWEKLWEVSIRADFQMLLKQQEEKAMPRGEAETVFENDRVRIIVPKNKEAACYYGQGTTWCTAATQSNNMFDTYSSSGPLYILLPKQPQYDGEKYQLHFESRQFMDEQDSQVEDLDGLLTQRFGDLLPFFRKAEPSIDEWLAFAPDDMLEMLIRKISTATMDHVSEMINEWETQDDYWYEYLRDKGYVYPEGHPDEGDIDWEAAMDADESYTSWNYEANDFIQQIREAVDLTPQEVREIARDVDYDYVSDPEDISKLDSLMAFNVSLSGGRDGDGGVSDWMQEHIEVRKKGDSWDVNLIYVRKDKSIDRYDIHT